ncbi:U32 family peptidase [Candidatus Pacearchaeota archaeon]|nr:U32 family peptidase [Candidatus Pacearchaeota archaeon]MBD3283345.1 U32 family peptidase [Candidatus Pacearchaeota archaeon]
MKNKPELLAPAGDFKSLTAAVNAGADAVYFGLQEFNMRARAKNFKISDLPKISKICQKNIKKYLTLNTIIYDKELKKLENIIKKIKPFVDAVICSDLAVMKLCKKYKIPFHISTQCSVSNTQTARFYKKLGAKRINLARELNLQQIKKISKIINTEIFIHGAMCISISGRCLISQFLFNESANRGKCIQPCRRPYNITDNQGNQLRLENNFILSPKDLCTLNFFEKIKKSGVRAVKIEGRNREPEYVDTVVRVYRKAIDKKLTKKDIDEGLKELNKVYNKGFSSGFYLKMPTQDDFSISENSSAKQSKKFIGKITHYYPKIKVGLLKLNTSEIKKGDEILIHSKLGVIRHKIQSMQIKHKSVDKAIKGQDVGIQLPKCKKGDELYKIIRKN